MNKTKPKTVCLNVQDNVAVALTNLAHGDIIDPGGMISNANVPAGHKIAICEIKAHDPVRKYGQIIGFASNDIQPGDHVHTHNLEMGDFIRDYSFGADARFTEVISREGRATFNGIVRRDGRVATRNYIGVLPTVNCSASVARFIAESFTSDSLAEFPNVDGVVSLGHGTGCAMVPDGEGFVLLQRTLAGYARHPNFAGILLVGLGCEVNQMEVYGYAEPVSAKGLVFMDTPGYDAVSVTGMVAGGANVICFTTGRGSVCGFKPVPTLKLASNTEMYRRLSDDMDVNCGLIVDGQSTVQEMGETIFRLILETASGKQTRSELLGFGDSEFVPWQIGPVM